MKIDELKNYKPDSVFSFNDEGEWKKIKICKDGSFKYVDTDEEVKFTTKIINANFILVKSIVDLQTAINHCAGNFNLKYRLKSETFSTRLRELVGFSNNKGTIESQASSYINGSPLSLNNIVELIGHCMPYSELNVLNCDLVEYH